MNYLDQTDLSLFKKKDSFKVKMCRCFGKILNYFYEPAAEIEHLTHQAYIHKARSPGSKLTTSEVKELETYMLDLQDLDMRRAYFRGRTIETTFQGQIIPLISWLLERKKDIKTILNIGSNYGYCEHIIATRFPQIHLTSVDFAPNLKIFNQEFEQPNLNFISGYALDLIEGGSLQNDVLMMSNTACVIKNAEVKRYLKNIADEKKYIIFNEPIFLLPGGAVIDPVSVNVNESIPAYQYKMSNGSLGSLCYIHNLKAMAEEAGLEILYYKAYKPQFTYLRLLQMIAGPRSENTETH